MRRLALNFYACPSCGKFPLEIEKNAVFVKLKGYKDSLPKDFHCQKYCARNQKIITEKDTAKSLACLECRAEHLARGLMRCAACEKNFSVVNFIPNFRLDDTKTIKKTNPKAFGPLRKIFEEKKLYAPKDQKEIIRAAIKNLLPYDRAKKGGARKNLDNDLEYRAEHPEKDRYVDLFRKLLKRKTKVTLELGIGQGGFTSSVKKSLKPEVFFGLDFEREWLEIAKLRDFETEVLEADAGFLPFRDLSVDLLFSAYTLEHISQTEKVVAEIARAAFETFLIFGPSKFSFFDFHFEKAPFLPLLPKSLAVRWAHFWKCRFFGFNYSKKEIAKEYAAMNYLKPSFFERLLRENKLNYRNLFLPWFLGSLKSRYQYHSFMRYFRKLGYVFFPFAWLIEKFKIQPILAYFIQKKERNI